MQKVKKAEGWASRITGHDDVAPDQLLANPRNWRTHPRAQQDALKGALDQVGWVQQVLVNQRTGHLVDGHMRVQLALRHGAPTVPVTYLDLSEEEEGLVLASLDPISAMAGRDDEQLRQLLAEISFDSQELEAAITAATGLPDEKEDEERYTDVVQPPHYEPTGERHAISDLYDQTRAQELRRQISAADLPDDVRAFLYAATGRHVVYHYQRIADWYAQTTPEIQRLMEASALVILDPDDAMARGYAKLKATLMELEEGDRDPARG